MVAILIDYCEHLTAGSPTAHQSMWLDAWWSAMEKVLARSQAAHPSTQPAPEAE